MGGGRVGAAGRVVTLAETLLFRFFCALVGPLPHLLPSRGYFGGCFALVSEPTFTFLFYCVRACARGEVRGHFVGSRFSPALWVVGRGSRGLGLTTEPSHQLSGLPSKERNWDLWDFFLPEFI